MIFRLAILLGFTMTLTCPVFARKGSEAVYQDPFDLAAGGASLTRASQDAVIFANPALLPWGNKIYRYSGFMPIVYGTPSVQDSIETLQGADEAELVSTVFETNPIQVGGAAIGSLVLKNFGLAMYQGSFLDLEAKKHGSASGGPSIDFEAAALAVVAMSFAGAVSDWFSLGLTSKYIYKTEPAISFPITDQEAIQTLVADPASLQAIYLPAAGYGVDLGMLFFSQGRFMDYNLAIKIDDVGGTSFSCANGSPCDYAKAPYKQVVAIGQSIAFHGTTHVISLAADYRDVLDSYEEKLFKKVHLGMKILLQKHIGFALGLHHGIPSYGFRFDLWMLKFGLTRYSVEKTNVIGEKRRDFAMAYFSLGW